MDTQELKTPATGLAVETLERVIVSGNLSELSPAERMQYYARVCESLGLNPLTRPFEYIVLNDKLTLYAKRDCTDQLRASRKITTVIVSREISEEVYVVTARAVSVDGRSDESIGAVPLVKEDGSWESSQNGKRYFKKTGKLIPLSPEDRANAMMKAETKAKRRVTLSLCGLGWLDESEIETVASAKVVHPAEGPEKPLKTLAKPETAEEVGQASITQKMWQEMMKEVKARRISETEFFRFLTSVHELAHATKMNVRQYPDIFSHIETGYVQQWLADNPVGGQAHE